MHTRPKKKVKVGQHVKYQQNRKEDRENENNNKNPIEQEEKNGPNVTIPHH